MKLRFATLLTIATIAIAAQHTVAQTTMTWTINGVKRQAIVYAPSKPTGKSPVIFAWHGHGGNMQGAVQLFHFHTIWPEAIVLYPQGLPSKTTNDPNGTKPGWQWVAGEYGDRDLKFFDEMLATMHQKFSVDDSRVYTAGFSNGGIFSYLLWVERGKQIAAVGEAAGRLVAPGHFTDGKPLLAIVGSVDTVDPTAEQEQTIADAKQINNATGQGQSCGQVCMFFSSTSHTPVRTYIHPGGHVYPSWASAQIVEFFKNHHL